MIKRRHSTDDLRSFALYSDCEAYRYLLSRTWDDSKQTVAFVMLNPSTATERANDPTIERCERRARRMGFDALSITNIFAFRATDPKTLKKTNAPDGVDNLETVLTETANADLVVAAWGTHGSFRDQGFRFEHALRAANVPLHHIGLTKHGHPRHPLYVSYDVQPKAWNLVH